MSNEFETPKTAMWLAEPLQKDVAASLARLVRCEDVCHLAVMPDVHLAGDVCNGTVVATRDLIYPMAIGGDIGCGMLAVGFDLEADSLSDGSKAARLLAKLIQHVPSNKHPRHDCGVELPAGLSELPLSHPQLEKLKLRDGLLQMGTLGRGNHFVEFQSDVEGRLWLMLHSGSRAMGHAITDWHLRSTKTEESGLGFVNVTEPNGQAYLNDMNWAVAYAMQNRLAMARSVEAIVNELFSSSIDWSTLIHCHHNHVQREVHFGDELWVHRKGALPAAEGEVGIIPGSMGTHSFHVMGRGCPDALRSSSHGAGRKYPRKIAAHRISRRDLERQMRGVWFDRRHAEHLRDEAPDAYKDVDRVMRAQRELTKIVRKLMPILVYKGS